MSDGACRGTVQLFSDLALAVAWGEGGVGGQCCSGPHLPESTTASSCSPPPSTSSSLPFPLRPSWLLLPGLSPLASSQAGTWQVDEGRVSHSFLENRGLDELPKGRGHAQPASPGALASLFCSRYLNCSWKKRGTYRLTLGVGPSFWLCLAPFSSVLCCQGARILDSEDRLRNYFLI